MYKVFRPYLTNIVLMTGVLFILLLNVLPAFFGPDINDFDATILDKPEQAGDIRPPGDTLLTYDAFMNIENNRLALKNEVDNINSGNNLTGLAMNLPFIGYKRVEECDTCTTVESFRHYRTATKYYVVLPGYKLTDPDSYFYMQTGQSFLASPHWDTTRKQAGEPSVRSGYYKQKPVPFRFASARQPHTFDQKGQVLISISEKACNRLSIFIIILYIITLLVLLYIILALPGKILLRISSGEIFTRQNIRQLNIIAWTLLSIPFAIISLQGLFRLIYHRYFTAEVQLHIWDTLLDQQPFLIAGLVTLAIAKAFQKGYSLQEEQDLTV